MPKGVYIRTQKHCENIRKAALNRDPNIALNNLKKAIEANTGKKRSKDIVEKVRLANIGKKRTLEQRKKISERHKGISTANYVYTIKRNCKICRKEFIINSSRDYCCSKQCKKVNKIKNDKKWKKENKYYMRLLSHRRKIKERQAIGYEFKIKNFKKKLQEIGECIFCGAKENLTIEHLIPISKGGTNEITNLFPSCRKCNFSKKNKNWIEWYRKREYYSRDRENKIIKMCS